MPLDMSMMVRSIASRAILAAVLGFLAVGIAPGAAVAATPAVTRTPVSADVSPGAVVTLTATPTGIAGFYAVEEELGVLELVGHTADRLSGGAFVMLEGRSFTYQVKVPDGAQEGQQFVVTGQWWTDPTTKHVVGTSETTLTVAGDASAAQVAREPSTTEIPEGWTLTVAVTPSNVAGFYAVKESLGSLELLSHTADHFDGGTFVMLQAQPFTYVVGVPGDASVGDQFTITGEWWIDPGDMRGTVPSETIVTLVPLVCGDLTGDTKVNVFDAITLLQIIVGLVEPTAAQATAADLNQDGDINVFDAITALQIIVGLTVIDQCGSL